jgi:hypothetical protein
MRSQAKPTLERPRSRQKQRDSLEQVSRLIIQAVESSGARARVRELVWCTSAAAMGSPRASGVGCGQGCVWAGVVQRCHYHHPTQPPVSIVRLAGGHACQTTRPFVQSRRAHMNVVLTLLCRLPPHFLISLEMCVTGGDRMVRAQAVTSREQRGGDQRVAAGGTAAAGRI